MSPNAIRAVRVSLILVAILLWDLYARLIATSLLTVAPAQVIEQLWPRVFGAPQVRIAILWTLFEMVTAFVLSVVVGMLTGVLIGLTNIGRRSFYPIVLLLYGIPQAILLPLFVLIFGLGPEGKIAFGFSHGVFPVIVNTIAGMRNVNPLLLHGAASMGASRFQQLRYVIFPHMVTAVFTGLRLAMTLTLLGVLLAELFVSQGGVGQFTLIYSDSNTAALVALILVLALMAVALNEMVRMVEAHYSRWKE